MMQPMWRMRGRLRYMRLVPWSKYSPACTLLQEFAKKLDIFRSNARIIRRGMLMDGEDLSRVRAVHTVPMQSSLVLFPSL